MQTIALAFNLIWNRWTKFLKEVRRAEPVYLGRDERRKEPLREDVGDEAGLQFDNDADCEDGEVGDEAGMEFENGGNNLSQWYVTLILFQWVTSVDGIDDQVSFHDRGQAGKFEEGLKFP